MVLFQRTLWQMHKYSILYYRFHIENQECLCFYIRVCIQLSFGNVTGAQALSSVALGPLSVCTPPSCFTTTA